MKDFMYYHKNGAEKGEIEQINAPVVFISGLKNVTLKEVILLETGQFGWIVGLHADFVEAFLLSSDRIAIGTKVVSTQQFLSVPVGDVLFGKTLPAFFDTSLFPDAHTTMQTLDVAPRRIDARVQITKPFNTGTNVVDLLIPLGRGQRELVIGDRKIGKTSFVMTTIKQQVLDGVIPILALIGKKQSEVKAIENWLVAENLKDKVILVVSKSAESPSAIFLTPFTAMAIAEYFAETGQDSVVILDDLSTHARCYRELSLIANQFPGRDSYPGDIFYTHARLLERAGSFKHDKTGSVSITCLPVVETTQRDFTGYIQTNLMGITDGHILFDSDIWANGIRPAVNISLSVSRAGKQTRSPLMQDIQRTLMSFLTQYEQLKSVSHFGTELTESIHNTLTKGELFTTYFNQDALDLFLEDTEVLLFALIWADVVTNGVSLSHVRTRLHSFLKTAHGKSLQETLFTSGDVETLTKNITTQKEVFQKLWQ